MCSAACDGTLRVCGGGAHQRGTGGRAGARRAPSTALPGPPGAPAITTLAQARIAEMPLLSDGLPGTISRALQAPYARVQQGAVPSQSIAPPTAPGGDGPTALTWAPIALCPHVLPGPPMPYKPCITSTARACVPSPELPDIASPTACKATRHGAALVLAGRAPPSSPRTSHPPAHCHRRGGYIACAAPSWGCATLGACEVGV